MSLVFHGAHCTLFLLQHVVSNWTGRGLHGDEWSRNKVLLWHALTGRSGKRLGAVIGVLHNNRHCSLWFCTTTEIVRHVWHWKEVCDFAQQETLLSARTIIAKGSRGGIKEPLCRTLAAQIEKRFRKKWFLDVVAQQQTLSARARNCCDLVSRNCCESTDIVRAWLLRLSKGFWLFNMYRHCCDWWGY